MARAYAVTVQCAAACTPFKNSDTTYATCCKQHAATAAVAPKPPIRPAVLKSKLLKPFSAGKLQQDQVAGKIKKTADDTNSTANRDTQKNPYQTISCAVNNGGDTSTQSGDNTDGGVKKDYRVGYRNDGLLGCRIKSCCHKGDPAPNVLCGSLSYRVLPNLSN